MNRDLTMRDVTMRDMMKRDQTDFSIHHSLLTIHAFLL